MVNKGFEHAISFSEINSILIFSSNSKKQHFQAKNNILKICFTLDSQEFAHVLYSLTHSLKTHHLVTKVTYSTLKFFPFHTSVSVKDFEFLVDKYFLSKCEHSYNKWFLSQIAIVGLHVGLEEIRLV